jgi:hypothetical protein
MSAIFTDVLHCHCPSALATIILSALLLVFSLVLLFKLTEQVIKCEYRP